MKQKQKQKGFSLIELSLVIAIIAILTVGINLAYNAIKDNIAFNKTIETIEYTFLNAAQSCLNQAGTLVHTTCTAPVVQSVTKLKDAVTPYGDTWTVEKSATDNAGTLTIKYPLTSYGTASEALALGSRLATKLNSLQGITATSATGILTLNYTP